MNCRLLAHVLLAIAAGIVTAPVLAQVPEQSPPAVQAETASAPVYKPPPRGAPAGRVGGASRSASAPVMPLPRIELLAPADHAGFTASPQPTLCFFVSLPVQWPMQFTISAPLQPVPVIEVTIPSPTAAGIYALPVSAYRVSLLPGIVYTWSVSIVIDPRAWSRNIVASAPIVFDPTLAQASPPTIGPLRRAAYFAEAGLWYDAIGAAMEAHRVGSDLAIAALMQQAGVTGGVAPDAGRKTQ